MHPTYNAKRLPKPQSASDDGERELLFLQHVPQRVELGAVSDLTTGKRQSQILSPRRGGTRGVYTRTSQQALSSGSGWPAIE
ncbi:MAG: hypothetical protein DDT39_01701 [Firmicutes bacterium]|nr:hypothetical protein [candidate division NPL-UPA2 bacterium]